MCTFGGADMQKTSLHFGSLPPGGELLSGPVGVEMPSLLRLPHRFNISEAACAPVSRNALGSGARRLHGKATLIRLVTLGIYMLIFFLKKKCGAVRAALSTELSACASEHPVGGGWATKTYPGRRTDTSIHVLFLLLCLCWRFFSFRVCDYGFSITYGFLRLSAGSRLVPGSGLFLTLAFCRFSGLTYIRATVADIRRAHLPDALRHAEHVKFLLLVKVML